MESLDSSQKTNGTCLLTYLEASYKTLYDIFGPPKAKPSGDGKVRKHWIIQLNSKVVFTIYDYKEYATPLEEVKLWHIGGKLEHDEEIKDFLLLTFPHDSLKINGENA